MPTTATATVTNTKSLVALIAERQTQLDLTDEQLATAVGFERSSIMGLIKSGAIKFPLSKIPALAQALDLDASLLLVTALKETSPDLLALIEEVWGPRDLTPEEGRLVQGVPQNGKRTQGGAHCFHESRGCVGNGVTRLRRTALGWAGGRLIRVTVRTLTPYLANLMVEALGASFFLEIRKSAYTWGWPSALEVY